MRAATGWDVTDVRADRVGERALNLARVFNMREGLTVEDDRLAERSYGPTSGGALADGGIDREELREAVHTYYGMMGWDKETGAPTVRQAGGAGRRLGSGAPGPLREIASSVHELAPSMRRALVAGRRPGSCHRGCVLLIVDRLVPGWATSGHATEQIWVPLPADELRRPRRRLW